jgi:Raf kinase inhibitor-like YbhB/YbcL family protein
VCALIALLLVAPAGCGGSSSSSKPASAHAQAQAPPRAARMTLLSAAFPPGGAIPVRYTCDGADISPPLSWSGVPSGTRQLALIVQDLDVRFLHWAVAGIDPRVRSLAVDAIPAGAVQGLNDFGRVGYGGPCPSRGGRPHRYRFTLYALATATPPAAGFDARGAGVLAGALATGSLDGTYRR